VPKIQEKKQKKIRTNAREEKTYYELIMNTTGEKRKKYLQI